MKAEFVCTENRDIDRERRISTPTFDRRKFHDSDKYDSTLERWAIVRDRPSFVAALVVAAAAALVPSSVVAVAASSFVAAVGTTPWHSSQAPDPWANVVASVACWECSAGRLETFVAFVVVVVVAAVKVDLEVEFDDVAVIA